MNQGLGFSRILVSTIFVQSLITILPLTAEAYPDFPIDLRDQSSCEASQISGTWTATNSTCRKDHLVLDGDHAVTVESGITLTLTGTIRSYDLCGDINNNGTVNNLGTIYNECGGVLIFNNAGGIINNYGNIYNSYYDGITNSGIINNFGILATWCDGPFRGTPVTGNPVIDHCGPSTLSLYPSSGADGMTVRAIGHNYWTYSTIPITFDGATIATTKTWRDGAFYAGYFTVPVSTSIGPHTVSVTDGTHSHNATFTVMAQTLSTHPDSGAAGIESNATGHNFIPGHGITITFDGTLVGTATAQLDGAFYHISFTVPASATVGPHTVSATDGTNTADATFTVKTSSLSLFPKSGAAGIVSNATGHAFIPSHGITITLDGATVATTTENKEGEL